jgi:peptidoglycan L-alanyl-D-glutamate endopeptidase CwlK
MYKFSKRSKDALKGVHPDLVRVMEAAISYSPVDFTVVEGVRTQKRQQELWAKGRTVPGAIVTKCDGIKVKSPHQSKSDGYGYAVDIYPYIDGKVQVNDAANLKRIALHIKQVADSMGINIDCGVFWVNFPDSPHIELKVKK